MTTSTDSLTRAIDYLGATDLGNGRYALFMGVDDPQHWLVTDANDLIRATFSDEDFKNTVRMPSWWTPTQQTAFICNACRKLRMDCKGGQTGHYYKWVTVNLETGEEVRV